MELLISFVVMFAIGYIIFKVCNDTPVICDTWVRLFSPARLACCDGVIFYSPSCKL